MKSRATRTIAMTAAAGLTATLFSIGWAVHNTDALADPSPSTPSQTQATPGHNKTTGPVGQSPTASDDKTTAPKPRTAQQGALGTASLLQYNDLNNNTGLTYLPHATIGDDEGKDGLSACTGQQSMADVAGIDSDRFHVAWTSDVNPLTVHEVAAGLGDQAHATTAMEKLVRGQRACQDEPAGHWRYGAEHTVHEGTGTATWFAATDGDGSRNGGVIVARNGLHVAVVEVNGKGVSDSGLTQLARSTVNRLA